MKFQPIKYLAIFGLVTSLPLSLSAQMIQNSQSVDWTPFFKNWENGCVLDDDMRHFVGSLSQDINSTDITKPHIWLPSAYQAGNLNKLRVTASSADVSVNANTTKKVDFRDIIMPLKGTYYGLPLSEIGINHNSHTDKMQVFFVVNRPIKTVENTLLNQKNIKFNVNKYPPITCDTKGKCQQEAFNPEGFLQVYTHQKNRTVVQCIFKFQPT